MLKRRHLLQAGAVAMAAPANAAPSGVRALVFDVFGTVVDWRSSVTREGEKLGAAKRLDVDWTRFADAWRGGYGPSMDKVRKGELPWMRIDALHRMTLDRLLKEFRIEGLTEAEIDDFNRVWHRLAPWPDSVAGLTRLKKRYVISTLSNGNTSLLVDMAKFAGLPWDCVLSAELAKRYKPDREVYLMAVDLLGLRPEEVMMVAAHLGDLRAAKAVGLKTAFVTRPREFGPDGKPDLKADASCDVSAKDFLDLAGKLGA
jgi:2-haloacid dehalogenase